MAETKLKNQAVGTTIVTTTGTQTLTNKTLTTPVLTGPYTYSGSTSVPNATTTAIITGLSGLHCYLVYAGYNSGEANCPYSSFAVVVTENNGTCRAALSGNGASLSISVADAGTTSNITVTQLSGTTLTINWNILQLY